MRKFLVYLLGAIAVCWFCSVAMAINEYIYYEWTLAEYVDFDAMTMGIILVVAWKFMDVLKDLANEWTKKKEECEEKEES